MDIIRNVGVCNLVVEDDKTLKQRSSFYHRNSLPNIELKYAEPEVLQQPLPAAPEPTRDSHIRLINSIDIPDEECAVSGRLQIRVVSQPATGKVMEQSPQPDESVYFDAITNGTIKLNRSDSNRSNNFDIKVYEDTLKIQKYKIVNHHQNNNEASREGSADPEEEVSKSESARNNKENESSRGAISKTSKPPQVVEPPPAEVDAAESHLLLRELSRSRSAVAATTAPTTDGGDNSTHSAINDANQYSSQHDELNDNLQNLDVRQQQQQHGSKIPVLNPNSPNVRISKCASWAGNEALLLQKELGELTPGEQGIYAKKISLA